MSFYYPAGGGGDLTLLSDTVLGADAASIDITGISAAYKHLQIVASLRSAEASVSVDQGNLTFNNDAGANYYQQSVFALGVAEDGAEGLAQAAFLSSWPAATATAEFFGPYTATILNYASTTMRKSINWQLGLLRGKTTGLLYVYSVSGHWDSAAAIDRLTFFATGSNVLAGSRVTIYGLA